MSSIGERLRTARIQRGLTQEALANLLDPPLTQGAIAHIENGRSETSRHIIWLALVLGLRIEWLLIGKGEMFEVQWPWATPMSEVATLPPHVLEDIGDYIQMKVSKHQVKIGNDPDTEV